MLEHVAQFSADDSNHLAAQLAEVVYTWKVGTVSDQRYQ
jgi:hypothetical protein